MPRNERHVGLFVEGVNMLTSRGRDDLAELWRYQCERLGRTSDVAVHGFSKQQLVLMDPAQNVAREGKVPLDILIQEKFRTEPFEVLVVAFDAEPANQAITIVPHVGEAPCLRLEKDFVLERFAASTFLPRRFQGCAARLLAHYRAQRSTPRPAARPPLGEVELIYMAPMFEDLALQDGAALRAVFGLRRTPSSWPVLHGQERPDVVLKNIVDTHRATGPRHLRMTYQSAKHAWALEILRKAHGGSPIWRHAIAERVQKVLPPDRYQPGRGSSTAQRAR